MNKPARGRNKPQSNGRSRAPAKLTVKQKRFVLEYLQDRNARAAYKRAGYSATGHGAEVNASRLLRLRKIGALVDELERLHQENLNISAERIREAYVKLAFTGLADVVTWDCHGQVTIKATGDLTPAAHAAIRKMEPGKYGIEVEMHDKLAALDSLARIMGLFEGRVEHAGPDGEPLISNSFAG